MNVLSTGNLMTVTLNETYSTSTTTNQTAASAFLCVRTSSNKGSTDSNYSKYFNLFSIKLTLEFTELKFKHS